MKFTAILKGILSTVILLFITAATLWSKTSVSELKCEYKIDPIGIDVLSPRLSWKLISDEYDVMQTAYEIKVAGTLADLNKKSDLLWSSGKLLSDQSVNVSYQGPELKSMQGVYWQVRIWDQKGKVSKWSAPAYWEMGLLQTKDWEAEWISYRDVDKELYDTVSPYFRNEFSIDKPVKKARIYASSLGLYELYLNGNRVGDQLFTPGWTSYKKRIQYQCYDVTKLMETKNAIGAIIGKGWYKGTIGWESNKGYYGDQTAVIVQLHVEFADGSEQLFVSDNEWKYAGGAILNSEIYNGESYEASLEPIGWNELGFDDEKWQSVSIFNHTKTSLIAQQGVPVKAIEELKPIKVFKTPKGEAVLDMGQNMVGLVRLKVKGEKGHKITLKFAEVLDKEGNFYTDNLRSAKATDVYILKGGETEHYTPHFTFHGFRYVQVIGYPGELTEDAITGIVVHSAMEKTGLFSSSNTMINQLQHNIQWGQKGNFLDVPTDCPQRDERLGWTGDAQVFSATAAFNFDVAAFFTKWLGDVSADQTADGKVPHVIPDVMSGNGSGATGWADAALVIPWNLYLAYGDTSILKTQYSSMKAWVEFMRSRAGEDFLWTEDWHFGDWLAFATTQSDYPGATTEKGLIATAYYSYSSSLLSKVAKILGKKEESNAYAQLSDNIKKAFNHEFVTPSGRLVSHTQTAYSLALSFDLLPPEIKDKAAAYLAGDVSAFGHLTTGFLGTPLLCKSLSDNGYEDLAFMLLMRKEYPSWLYPITQGATTIWERWDGQKPDGSFQDLGMNSFNHYAYGAIGEWMYSYIAGIQIDVENPGYKHFYLAPHIGGDLSNASASLKTMYGQIESKWKKTGKEMNYEFAIPPNSNATVCLTETNPVDIFINNKALTEGNTFDFVREEGKTKIKLGSGRYVITYSE